MDMFLVTKKTFSRGKGFHTVEQFVTADDDLAMDYRKANADEEMMVYVDIDTIEVWVNE